MNPSTPAPFPFPPHPDAPVPPPCLSDIALPDLLQGIGEDFAHDFQNEAPDAFAALMQYKVAANASNNITAPLSQPAPVHSAPAARHPPIAQTHDIQNPTPVPINDILDHLLTAAPNGQQQHLQTTAPARPPVSLPVPVSVPPVNHPPPMKPITQMETVPAVWSQPQSFPFSPATSQPSSILRRPAPPAQPTVPDPGVAAAAAAAAAVAAAAAAAAPSSSIEVAHLQSAALPQQQIPQVALLAHPQAQPLGQHPHHPVAPQPLLHAKQQPQLVVPTDEKPVANRNNLNSTPSPKTQPVPAPVPAPVPTSTPFVARTTHVRFAPRVSTDEPGHPQTSQDSVATTTPGLEGEDDQEQRKAMRAERNRQSAAASRERRKHYIKELERRVALLSRENATLQCGQLSFIRERLDEESRLVEENNNLRRDLEQKESEINELAGRLADLKSGDKTETKTHATTWDGALWRRRREGAAITGSLTRPSVQANAPWKE